MPFQGCKPICLSGPAVVPLENTDGFNAINVKQPSKELSKVPLTMEQQDIKMRHDMSGVVPYVQEVHKNKKIVLMDRNTTFNNNVVDPAKFTDGNIPEYMVQAGPQCDQKLLNPSQRRTIHDFEKRQKQAEELVRKAQGDRMKTRKQMSGLQYHRGVLMVDSSDNMASEIYGDRAKLKKADDEYHSQIQLERMSRLATKRSAMATNGNILVPETLGPRVKINNIFQSKGGDFHALSHDETHNRLFCRLQGSNEAPRTQRLRDIELSGKQYNITQHTIIEHWPAKNFERNADSRMKHPSQHSLEAGRNLQGTLRPV